VRGKAFGLKIVTLRTEVPPATIDIGVKLLFICAGKDRAWTTVTGEKTREEINMEIRTMDLTAFILMNSPNF
jgi:hypothetical protein